MKGRAGSPAKITRPYIRGIFPRKRLFRLLDKSSAQPFIWITAPAGSGKTTLVASYIEEMELPCLWYQVDRCDDDAATFFYYMGLAAKKAAPRYRNPLPFLTAEYLIGLSTFTLKYFEKLYERVRGVKDQSFVLVFDNYQEVPSASMFHEIIRTGLDNIPSGVRVVVISRSEPPDTFARMRANNQIKLIEFDELRLTMEETAGIMRLKVKEAFAEDHVQKAYDMTQGWAAGLILALEKTQKGMGLEFFNDAGMNTVFNYFASEILQKTDIDIQVFLLKTAFFPHMTAQMAEQLTGNENSSRILSWLTSNNFFTERRRPANPVYQYHPLFREFLLSRARGFFAKKDFAELQRKTGSLLEESGQLEDAVSLYSSSSDHEGVMRMIMTLAPALITEGRGRVLDEWIMSVPEEVRSRAPWLLYWLGVCRMFFNGEESEALLERAFNEFRLRKEVPGIYLSWAGIVDCNAAGIRDSWKLDKWIEVLDEVMLEHALLSMEAEAHVSGGMLYALSVRRPEHPAINDWERRLTLLLPRVRDTGLKMNLFFYLAAHYISRGDLDNLKRQIKLVSDDVESMERSGASSYPMALINLKHMEANYSWQVADTAASLQRLREALKVAGSTGIHVWDFILCAEVVTVALCSEDFDLADEYLRNMKPAIGAVSNFCIGYYHHQNAWYCFLRENYKDALMHAKISHEHGLASGNVSAELCSYLAMAYASFKAGEQQKASRFLSQALKVGRRMNSKSAISFSLMTEAYFAKEKGLEKKCIEVLRRAFPLAREISLMHFLFWIPSVMSALCAAALENGIETEYVKSLITRRSMIPDNPHEYIENWPYPFKIYAFGRFGIFKNEKPLSFSGKVQKKPLEMLKILLSLGGKKVREGQLTDLLWPEADGEAAHSTFKMTLSRLRQLCGNEKIIRIQEGRITLDPSYCYADVWAFERLLSQVDELMRGHGNTPLSPLLRGEFAPPLKKGDAGGFPEIIEITRLTDKAISIYKGHFLADDTEKEWALSMREKLRSKFIQLISRTGQYCEQAGEFTMAVGYYRKGLDIDSLSEEFCQRLMKCYKKLGWRTEAIQLYNWCGKMLNSAMGISPSPETEAIYNDVIKKTD